MRRTKFYGLSLVFMGVGLLAFALGLGMTGNAAYAQEDEKAEYVGGRECRDCHRDLSRAHSGSAHDLALQNVKDKKEQILADFSTGEEVRQVQLPGQAARRAFTPEDITYAVGIGRYVQRYLYEVAKDQYVVLPAEWNTLEKTWQPYGAVENWPNDAAYDWGLSCAGCHTTGLNVEKMTWEDNGVQCEACHGPGSIHVDAADKAGSTPSESQLEAIRTAIVLSPDPQICGQCHSRGKEPGDNRSYPVQYYPGQNLLAEDVFQLVAPNDTAHWWPSGHAKQANMQFNEWFTSAHASALTTLKGSDQANDTCLQCHSTDYVWTQTRIAKAESGEYNGSPPTPITLDNAQFGITCTTCHISHGTTEQEAGLVSDSYALCTSCHQDTDATNGLHHPVKEMFEGTTIVGSIQGIPSPHFTAENGAQCVDCHMTDVPVESALLANHTLLPVQPVNVIGVDGLQDSCTRCHTDVAPAQMQQFIDNAKSDTERRLRIALASVTDSSPEWVRTALDFIVGDGSLGVHNTRYTKAMMDAVEVELGLVQTNVPAVLNVIPVENPAACAECHQDQHRQWLDSPHAKASLSDAFRKEYANQGQPTYCFQCHASGYDPASGQFTFEGVVCGNCHIPPKEGVHPPAPYAILGTDSATCGRCHSGAHAPTYDEWLVSEHRLAEIDCVDCHTPHNNGLVLGDINTTCGNCHLEATIDEIHMGDNMNCVDCHMQRRTTANGVHVIQTGHNMAIDPSVCASCHGNTHLLSARGEMVGLTPDQEAQIKTLQDELTRVREQANQSQTSGVIGGAVGTLVLLGIGFIMMRRGKRS